MNANPCRTRIQSGHDSGLSGPCERVDSEDVHLQCDAHSNHAVHNIPFCE